MPFTLAPSWRTVYTGGKSTARRESGGKGIRRLRCEWRGGGGGGAGGAVCCFRGSQVTLTRGKPYGDEFIKVMCHIKFYQSRKSPTTQRNRLLTFRMVVDFSSFL